MMNNHLDDFTSSLYNQSVFVRKESVVEGTVLLIEDDLAKREALARRLQAEGIEVIEAGDGATGLAKAARFLPQAVIISTTLPDTSGSEVARKLREVTRTQHIFLMLIADVDSHGERLSGLELGADDFVAAPVDPDEVMLRVRNALRRAGTSNAVDPTTGLPAIRLIQEQLRRLLREASDNWALLRVHVTGLDPYRERYGHQRAAAFLREIGRMLAQALDKDTVEDDSLGFSGNDDFIIITEPQRVESLRAEMARAMEVLRRDYYADEERLAQHITVDDRSYPLVGLKVHVITPEDGPFYDVRSLSAALAAR